MSNDMPLSMSMTSNLLRWARSSFDSQVTCLLAVFQRLSMSFCLLTVANLGYAMKMHIDTDHDLKQW